MRLSPTQIAALDALAADPGARIGASTRRALAYRGLADADGLTALGRKARNDLRDADAEKPETRIHLENEPATQAQIRAVRRSLGFSPEGLSKENASILLGYLGTNKPTPVRLASIGKLLAAGTQSVDAINWSDDGPFATGSGAEGKAGIASVDCRPNGIAIVPVVVAGDRTATGRPVILRRQDDVLVRASKAADIFAALAKTI